MKRSIWFLALTLALLTSMFGAAFSPVAAEGGDSIKLISAQHVPGKGVVFIFEVTGDAGKDGFAGSVTINGQDFNLENCVYRDDGKLACVSSRGLSKYVTNVATANLNGYSSSAPIHSKTYCYSVFDYYLTNLPLDTQPADSAVDPLAFELIWENVGRFCQDSMAMVGDSIIFYNPTYGEYFDYYFRDQGEDGPFCLKAGPGYYYPCPFLNTAQ
jgi:hypothetical protein